MKCTLCNSPFGFWFLSIPSDSLPFLLQKILRSCWYHFTPKEGILTLEEVQLSSAPALSL